MAPFVAMVVGSLVRAGLAAVSGAGAITAPSMQAESAVTATDDVQLLMSAVGGVITILWSMWQKKKLADAASA